MIDKGQIVPKAGAWAKDGYQISYDATPTYEKALVDYLIGKYWINMQKYGTKKKYAKIWHIDFHVYYGSSPRSQDWKRGCDEVR